MALPALPKLPPLLQQKFTKTGYTRGATQREIYQNRVTRNNTVLIPLAQWEQCRPRGDGTPLYEKGYIVLVDPSWYFPKPDAEERLKEKDLELGHNALLLYQNRADWESFGPPQIALHSGPALTVASSRTSPLCGNYFARIHATVADDVGSLVEGYCSSSLRGAGIRVYEYASSSTLRDTRLQLECLFWRCYDYAEVLAATTMNQLDMEFRRTMQLSRAEEVDLFDYSRLRELRVLASDNHACYPLCLKPLSAAGLLQRLTQAAGRETYDITTTEISMFHIEEMRPGALQHRSYNLGWGHHHCNVVAKDVGIQATLDWMRDVLAEQEMIVTPGHR